MGTATVRRGFGRNGNPATIARARRRKQKEYLETYKLGPATIKRMIDQAQANYAKAAEEYQAVMRKAQSRCLHKGYIYVIKGNILGCSLCQAAWSRLPQEAK